MAAQIGDKQEALLGLRVMLALEQRKWGVHQLAKQSRVPLSAVQRICRGQGKQPSLWTIVQLATTLEVSLDYLAGRTDDPTPPRAKPRRKRPAPAAAGEEAAA